MALMLLESFKKYPFSGNAGQMVGGLTYYLAQAGWGSYIDTNGILGVGDPRIGGFGLPEPNNNITRPGQQVISFSGFAGNRVQIYYNGKNGNGLSFGNEITIGFRLYNELPGPDPSIYYRNGDDNHVEIWDSNTAAPRLHVAIGQSHTNNSIMVRYNGLDSVDEVPFGQTYNMSTYYEYSVKMSTGSSGSIRICRDGVEIYNKTGIQTANSWYQDPIHHFGIGGTALQYGIHKMYNDLYVTNDLNTLGEIRVDALYPSGDGTHNDFTANGNTSSHWANVDEQFFDDDLTYNYGTQGSNLYEDYTIQTLPDTPNTIFAIQVSDRVRKSDAGTASIKSTMYNKNTSTYSYFPTIDATGNTPISLTWTTRSFVSEIDPFTSVKWTKDSLANVQFGYNIP